jgi:hypothetical protein
MYWHMNMHCLVKLHVDMLTLFNILLIMSKCWCKNDNRKMPLHLTCRNNHDGVFSILFMVFNLLLISPNFFFGFKYHEFLQICMIFCKYVNIMWSYMYKRHEGTNVKSCNEFGNDLMNMHFKHNMRTKVNHRIKNLTIVFLSSRLWFVMEHFLSWFFYAWECTYFLLLHCGVHLLKVLHNN